MASVLSMYERYGIGGEVVVHPTWVPDHRLRTAGLTLASLELVRRLASDAIVHVHISERGSFVREGAILTLASRRGLRTVVTIHGADFLAFAEAHRKLTTGVLRRARAILCLSDAATLAVRAMVPGARVSRMPNPAVIDEGSPPADTTAELVLFAGEIGVRKGADVLERAWPLIADARPEARCVLVGPPTSLHVEAVDRLSVLEPMTLDGVKELVRQARVVVLPSRAEAMPMILIEAQGAARPFVATPVGAIPELAEHGGVLVPVGDADALSTAVIDLLSHADRAVSLGGDGQSYARETRSVAVVDARLRALYDEL
jgi:glycosyltransferase involved in cell wall biosynthesis